MRGRLFVCLLLHFVVRLCKSIPSSDDESNSMYKFPSVSDDSESDSLSELAIDSGITSLINSCF